VQRLDIDNLTDKFADYDSFYQIIELELSLEHILTILIVIILIVVAWKLALWFFSMVWYVISFKWLFGDKEPTENQTTAGEGFATKAVKAFVAAKAVQTAHNLANPPVVYVTRLGTRVIDAKVIACVPKGSQYEVHYLIHTEGFATPSKGKRLINRGITGCSIGGTQFRIEWP
jgi:hypothetical protein